MDKIGIVKREGGTAVFADSMKYLSADEMRSLFLEFFMSKKHKVLPSASLIPHGDASLLLTGAGMVPFKPYFLGQEDPEFTRVTTCQRCIRTLDIDNVGKTDRHGTFFEMLGNFSFGDYFKYEAISWAWEFVTKHLELDEDKVWVSVYLDDDEAYQIWNETIKVPKDRIVRLGKEDNFWEIGVGYPCGPCSEIYYDRGSEFGCGDPNCRPGCDCERFMEFWNLVFIQYILTEVDKYEPLENKGIDTGMGMERIVALMQNAKSIFDIDSVRPVIDKAAKLADTQYGINDKNDESLRVIADHVRGLTFMVSDGILPSNEGRGYVLRRLLRRAARHGRLLGIKGQFLLDIVDVVIEQMKAAYPELEEKRDYIHKVISLEENRFHETLDQGIGILQGLIQDLSMKKQQVISGSDVFRLYDTYGFPVELTREIAEENGFTIDETGFQDEMERQRNRARAAHIQKDYLDWQAELYHDLRTQMACTFVGYEHTEYSSTVAAIIQGDQCVEQITAGEEGLIILFETPFYAESGGQAADSGTITGKMGQFRVDDVRHPVDGIITHKGMLVSGELKVGDSVLATVYSKNRLDTARHHSSTHLLQKALRDVLGDHVHQSGSHVDADRLRFDFTHFEAVTSEQLSVIEKKVNEAIMANYPVNTEIMSINEAKTKGAIALFGEKYNESVRVVKMGESLELCGGTHVQYTGDIGLFRIISEGSIASGVRRIEAVSGKRALAYMDRREKVLLELGLLIDAPWDRAVEQLNRLLERQKSLEEELMELKSSEVHEIVDKLVKQAESVNGTNLVVAEVDLTDAEQLRNLGDRLRDKLAPAVIFLGAKTNNKVLFLAMASKDIASKRVHVGNVIKQAAKTCGGGGGGRADMAQAGGRLPEKLPEALKQAREMFITQLEEKETI